MAACCSVRQGVMAPPAALSLPVGRDVQGAQGGGFGDAHGQHDGGEQETEDVHGARFVQRPCQPNDPM